jgi:hypothetical protein
MESEMGTKPNAVTMENQLLILTFGPELDMFSNKA